VLFRSAGRETQALAEERLVTALAAIETLAEQRDRLTVERDQLRNDLTQTRERARGSVAAAHRLAMELETARNARTALEQGLQRLGRQLTATQAQRARLSDAIAATGTPLQALKAELDRHLSERLELEQELSRARTAVEATETGLREQEQARLRAEQEALQQRNHLDQLRLQLQELLVRSHTLLEQLQESGFQAAALLADLPAEAGETSWQGQLEGIASRIQRLGPINLAAIDELQQEAERKQYLDAQHDDISRSLATLEEAIRKIDRETRTRFKETFDQVNNGLQALFPRLFGGGHAYLELTGDNLLDTGISLMARPPGKRNSSIHLLSGGEKALTAVALVFAIFELNPAPFCMLDEVDAPLDEANVGRFCELVKSLSDQVQFIFITHNKVTMELAHQLTGVTMHEPGVSRLVSVDVEEAVQLAAV
jgi:chromosome segregation protein